MKPRRTITLLTLALFSSLSSIALIILRALRKASTRVLVTTVSKNEFRRKKNDQIKRNSYI